MKILIESEIIETTDIADIQDIEKHTYRSSSRIAGFVLIMMDGTKKIFAEGIPYESYPYEIAAKKDKWQSLRERVTAQWSEDKTEIKHFKL